MTSIENRRMVWFGLRLRIASLVVGLVALTWLGYALLVEPRVQDSLRRETERGISLYARLTAAQIDETMAAALRELESIASLPALQSMDPTAVGQTLATFDHTSPHALHFFLLDRNGLVVARPSKPARIGADRSKREYFRRVTATRQPYVSEAVISTAGNRSLVAAVPVFDDARQLVGVLIGSLGFMDRNSQLYAAIVHPRVDRPIQVFLVTRRGTLIASSLDPETSAGAEAHARAHVRLPRSPVSAEENPTVVSDDGKRWLVTSADVQHLDWHLIVRIPNAVVDADVANISQGFRVAVLISLAGVLLLGLIIAQWLLGPLDRLTRALRTYGDTGSADPIVESGPAEIRHAQRAFNAMMAERARARADRARLQTQLLQAQKLQTVGTLAGGISHDFNNLLTPILLASQYLVRALPADSRPGAMARDIAIGATRASELVSRILTFSRAAEPRKQPLDAAAVVNEAVKLVEVSMPSHIQLATTIEPVGVICADATQLSQVLLNLCSNAVDALGQQPGQITVSLGHADEPTRCVISVADTGSGIFPETLEQMFDPFFTTKEVGKGTGLGLSVVHGIITDHDGTIEVDSQPGRGTRIDIFLPLVDARVDNEPEEVPVGGGNERILLVEDDPMVAKASEQLLRDLGYPVEVETDPRVAIERVRAQPEEYDLIVCDLSMPHLSGFDLIHTVREFRPSQRFAIVTGNIDQTTHRRCAELRVGAVVKKPFKTNDLAAALRTALEDSPDSAAEPRSTRGHSP